MRAVCSTEWNGDSNLYRGQQPPGPRMSLIKSVHNRHITPPAIIIIARAMFIYSMYMMMGSLLLHYGPSSAAVSSISEFMLPGSRCQIYMRRAHHHIIEPINEPTSPSTIYTYVRGAIRRGAADVQQSTAVVGDPSYCQIIYLQVARKRIRYV